MQVKVNIGHSFLKAAHCQAHRLALSIHPAQNLCNTRLAGWVNNQVQILHIAGCTSWSIHRAQCLHTARLTGSAYRVWTQYTGQKLLFPFSSRVTLEGVDVYTGKSGSVKSEQLQIRCCSVCEDKEAPGIIGLSTRTAQETTREHP